MKKQSSGKTMIEILGVLSIVGLLSISGIKGYTLAMERNQANQILDISNKYSLQIFDACRRILQNGHIGLVSLKHCSPATPGIPKFPDLNKNQTIPSIYNNGILFSKITEHQNYVYKVHIELRLNEKNICQTVKSIAHIESGCIGNKAPYIVTIPFKHY